MSKCLQEKKYYYVSTRTPEKLIAKKKYHSLHATVMIPLNNPEAILCGLFLFLSQPKMQTANTCLIIRLVRGIPPILEI